MEEEWALEQDIEGGVEGCPMEISTAWERTWRHRQAGVQQGWAGGGRVMGAEEGRAGVEMEQQTRDGNGEGIRYYAQALGHHRAGHRVPLQTFKQKSDMMD